MIDPLNSDPGDDAPGSSPGFYGIYTKITKKHEGHEELRKFFVPFVYPS